MATKQIWLTVKESYTKSVINTLENLLKTITAYSDGLSDDAGNPIVVITLDTEELPQAQEYLDGKEDMRFSCVLNSGIFENDECMPWPEDEKTVPVGVNIDLTAQNRATVKNSVRAYLDRHPKLGNS